LIQKAYNALSRTLNHENTQFVEMEDMDVFEAEEIDDEDIGIEEDIIQSELIGKPFILYAS